VRGRFTRAALAALATGGLAGGLACAEEPREPSGEARPSLPAPDRPIPREAGRLAHELGATSGGLREAVARWRSEGDPGRGTTPRDVTLLALHQQRMYILLGRRRALAGRVLDRLGGSERAEARDIVAARQALERLNQPTRRVRFRTGPALPPDVLLAIYRRAERRFRVDWEVLAAINFVETGFNKIRSSSSAGAQGPMQFIPSTWRAYGMGGDIRDPRDAIMGAANYLRASGAPSDYGRALYAYNPSPLYVRAVRRYARRIRSRPYAYYALHSWQIFVRTTRGLTRLTGPRPR